MKDKKGGYIDKVLKKIDNVIQEGVKKADKTLEEIVELSSMSAKKTVIKTSKELCNPAKKERETLQKKGIKKINQGLLTVKKVTSNVHDDLEILKKQNKLRKTIKHKKSAIAA